MPDQDASATLPTIQRPNVTISERHVNPEVAMSQAGRANEMPYALCMIVAAVLFVIMALILWMDFSQLRIA